MDFKLNLKKTFQNMDGKSIKMGEGAGDLTVKDALKMVCVAELPEDTKGSGQEVLDKKMKNWDIYMKISNTLVDEIELTPEEITHIKLRAPFILNVLTLGPLINMLSGK